jgi:glycosyltransferase involved in cell wall biosynthesis
MGNFCNFGAPEKMLRLQFPVAPSTQLLLARIRRSALGRKAWDLLRPSAAMRRLVSPFRLPADVSEFDAAYYLRENPDVAASGMDPLYHYLRYGREGGRYPNAQAQQRSALRLQDLCNPYEDECTPTVCDEAFRISVLTPSFNTEPCYLRELFQTLRNQNYSNWEWIVVDDGSIHAPTIATLREFAAADSRVRIILNPANRGISAATNTALATATGHYAALVDHDDLLSRDAFLEVYKDWKLNPATQLYYTDECKLNSAGKLEQLWPKPDWAPTYLENTMCIGHLAVYQMHFLRELGGFRSEYDGTQDFDLALRAALRNPRVHHLPLFAYIWRIIPGSAALDVKAKKYAVDRQRRAVLEYARRRIPDAQVTPDWEPGYWRIKYPLPSPPPLLSYVIPAGGGSRVIHGERVDLIINCIRSFEKCGFYPNREYVVIHGGDLTSDQLRQLQAFPSVVVVQNTAPAFNFSQALNLGVAHSSGEYLCLVNDDVEAITPRGGEELVSYLAANSRVGVIGPLCLYEDGTIQQNGVVLLEAAGPSHAGFRQPRDFGGPHGMLRCRREVFGIGAAMMFIKKSVYLSAGGFGEDLPLNYNDVEFCLKLRDHGYSCVVDPKIEVYHYESTTQHGMTFAEQELLYVKHPSMSDPYFSKWFDPADPNFRINFRQRKPRELNFGSWFDRHVGHRAANLVPAGRHKLSVCVAVQDQPTRLLDDVYRSVLMQSYDNKELFILDNGSSNPETMKWLARTRREGRAKFIRVDDTTGFREQRRKLLEAMTGDFFIPVAPDDYISVDALQVMAHAIEKNPGRRIFYSDEYDGATRYVRKSPYFKPDFDPVLLMNRCYPACLMAVEAEFLRVIETPSDDRSAGSSAYQTVLLALALGEEPMHVRELLYASRDRPYWSKVDEAQRFALTAFLRKRGLDEVLSVELNTLHHSAATWKLTAHKPLPNVKILDARQAWATHANVASLVKAASEPGVEWLAILLEPQDPRALLELSAIAWLDPHVAAVSGILTDWDRETVRWSGGLFLPGGRLFDPYAGKSFSDGGHHGQLWCQRCIDVAAPVNVLIGAKALVQAAARTPENAGADGLMIMLGLLAHEAGDFIAVTPHLRDVIPPASLVLPPLDRRGLLLGAAALERGSRWYDGRLSLDPVYGLWDIV